MIFNVLNLLQKRSHSPDLAITASYPWLGTTSCSTLTHWFGRTSRKGDELPFQRHSSRNQLGFHQRRVDIKLILGWYWVTVLNSYSLRLNHNCLGFNSHMDLSRDGVYWVYPPKKNNVHSTPDDQALYVWGYWPFFWTDIPKYMAQLDITIYKDSWFLWYP